MIRKLFLFAGLALCVTSCFEEIDYDCSVFPQAQTSDYVLPWQTWHVYVAYPHAARETTWQRYAIDIWMPIGTEVLAIRSGFVIEVEESFTDYDNTPGHENYVYVAHADSTVARYLHLTNDGAKVRVGEYVRKGGLIGYSGHTGKSSDPHLHIDLLNNNSETLPLSFQNARAEAVKGQPPPANCGLRNNIGYTALPY